MMSSCQLVRREGDNVLGTGTATLKTGEQGVLEHLWKLRSTVMGWLGARVGATLCKPRCWDFLPKRI